MFDLTPGGRKHWQLDKSPGGGGRSFVVNVSTLLTNVARVAQRTVQCPNLCLLHQKKTFWALHLDAGIPVRSPIETVLGSFYQRNSVMLVLSDLNICPDLRMVL